MKNITNKINKHIYNDLLDESAERLVLLFFTKEWLVSSFIIEKFLLEISDKYGDKVVLRKVELSDKRLDFEELSIQEDTSTVIVIRNREIAFMKSGIIPKSKLERIVEEELKDLK